MLALLVFVILSAFMIFLPNLFTDAKDFHYPFLHFKFSTGSFSNIPHNGANSLSEVVTAFKGLAHENFRVFFLWTQALILWVLGCYSWILQVNSLYPIVANLSILLCAFAIYLRTRTINTDFDYV